MLMTACNEMKTIEISVLGSKEVGRKSWAKNWQFQRLDDIDHNDGTVKQLTFIKLINSNCQFVLRIFEPFTSDLISDRFVCTSLSVFSFITITFIPT